MREQPRVRVLGSLLRRLVEALAVHANILPPGILRRQRRLAHLARLLPEPQAREHARELVSVVIVLAGRVLARAAGLDGLLVALVVLRDQRRVVARLAQAQQEDEDGGIGFADVALLELLEALLDLLLDRVVELALDVVELALDDVHEPGRELDDWLAVDQRRLGPPEHDRAQHDLSVTEVEAIGHTGSTG